MQSLIRSKSAGVTGGRGTAGAGPGRDLLYTAVTGVHLVRLPPTPLDDPRGPKGPGPRPRLGAMARRVGCVAPPPPLPVPVDGRRPPAVRG